MFSSISLNNFSSLLEVFIAFNAAFVIGNHFEVNIYKYFYFKGKDLEKLIDKIKVEFYSLDNFLDEVDDDDSQSKKAAYKESLLKEKEDFQNLEKKATEEYCSENPVFSIICFMNVFYCLFLLIMSALEPNHNTFIINLIVIVTLLSLVYFFTIEGLATFSKKYNWWKNPVISVLALMLFIILGISYSTLCKIKFPELNNYFSQLDGVPKTFLYLGLVSYPMLHFILFFNTIRKSILKNERNIISDLNSFYEKLNKESENEEVGLLREIKSWKITYLRDKQGFTRSNE